MSPDEFIWRAIWLAVGAYVGLKFCLFVGIVPPWLCRWLKKVERS